MIDHLGVAYASPGGINAIPWKCPNKETNKDKKLRKEKKRIFWVGFAPKSGESTFSRCKQNQQVDVLYFNTYQ